MIASTKKSIEKFADAQILEIIPQIKVTKYSCNYAKAFLYVFVDENDVERIENERGVSK